jgi:hypothetical protein
LKKFLNTLPIATVERLARDAGISTDRRVGLSGIISQLVGYYASYRLTVADLLARYPDLHD